MSATADPALVEVVEHLATIVRGAGSPGEREAAEWLTARLRAAGADAECQPAEFLDGYAGLMAGLSAAGLLCAGLAGRGPRARAAATLGAAAIAAAIVDDASNGPRYARRLFARRRDTQNVVAVVGDREADRTLVVMAHHDAAPAGFIFDQTAQHFVADRWPAVIDANDTSLPQWWPVAGGPGLIALGALSRRRRLVAAGAALCAGSLAAFADIARDRIVPGANDNLSAVAALVALAERLRARPLDGNLRVLLVSCGAEEVLQGGVHQFVERYEPQLDRDSSWLVNLDTVGSPELVLLEGEGTFVMEDYTDWSFRDRIAAAARTAGVPLRRGMRARASTDAVIASRAGYPTATLCSVDYAKALSNYHAFTDTPANLDYSTVTAAVDVVEATARSLAQT